jgi:integrase
MGSVYRQKNRTTYEISYYRDGRQIKESAGTDNYNDARDLLKKREGAIADGKPVSERSNRLRFNEAAADVVHDYDINGKRTLDHVTRRIRLHLTPFFGGRRMSAITTPVVRIFVAERKTAGASNAEINRELAILKRAFSLAIKAGILSAKPYIPMLKENNVRKGFFEREQFDAIVAHLPERLQPIIQTAYWTGWRTRAEIMPLEWSRVDTDAQVMRLDVGETKNDDGRTFPYGVLPDLANVIDQQVRVRKALQQKGIISPWVFPDDRPGKVGDRLSENFYKAWKQACRLAGHPGKIPHDFRRTAVRNLTRANIPEKTAMLLTGHKTRSVFDRYDIVNEDDLKAAVARLAAKVKPLRQDVR